MSTKHFNFNNEADLTPIEVNDETGVVEFTLDGQVATFESVQEFAEFYALARNVVPENLKNWTLTEDGNHVAFVLRAGTAGLDAHEIATLVTGLRSAGMTPEEIGRVIASTQANTEVAAVATVSSYDLHIAEMTSLVNDLSELDRHVLLAHYEVHEDIAHLIELLVNEYIEYDADGEYDDEYDDGKSLWDILHLELNAAVNEATNEYAGIPKTLAKSLYAGFYGDQDDAFETLRKAHMTATAASRRVQVYVYHRDLGRGEYVPYDYVALRRLEELRRRETVQLVVENKKIYVIHN